MILSWPDRIFFSPLRFTRLDVVFGRQRIPPHRPPQILFPRAFPTNKPAHRAGHASGSAQVSGRAPAQRDKRPGTQYLIHKYRAGTTPYSAELSIVSPEIYTGDNYFVAHRSIPVQFPESTLYTGRGPLLVLIGKALILKDTVVLSGAPLPMASCGVLFYNECCLRTTDTTDPYE